MPKKKRQPVPMDVGPHSEPFNPAFAVLAGLKAQTEDAELEAVPPSVPEATALEPPGDGPQGTVDLVRSAARLVLRKEKKGRGGKTVTRVEGLGSEPELLAELARTLAKALGCGATVDEEGILLQGNQSQRAASWFRDRGARRVIIGDHVPKGQAK